MNRRTTVKSIILEILGERRWIAKGPLEDALRKNTGSYGDTTARRLREMVEAGEIVKAEIEGVTVYGMPDRAFAAAAATKTLQRGEWNEQEKV